MKKIIGIMLTLIMVVAMTSVFAGCSSSELNGTWEGYAYSVKNGTKSKTDIVRVYIDSEEIYFMEKDEEETFSDDEGDLYVYKYVGYEIFKKEKIVVFYDVEDYCYEFYYDLNGDSLTLTNGDVVIELQKK